MRKNMSVLRFTAPNIKSLQREMMDQLSQHLIYDYAENYFNVNSNQNATATNGMITSEKFTLAFIPMMCPG